MMIGTEAQMVMTMRLMGMIGGWNVTDFETARMLREKPATFGKAARAASEAFWRGEDPVEVMEQALRPVRQTTRANSRRLLKRGPFK